jgi:hypothetical protein
MQQMSQAQSRVTSFLGLIDRCRKFEFKHLLSGGLLSVNRDENAQMCRPGQVALKDSMEAEIDGIPDLIWNIKCDKNETVDILNRWCDSAVKGTLIRLL